jgi:predicted DNA-binding protein
MINKHEKSQDVTRERVLSFRVTFEDLDTLKRTARNNGTTVSTIIRKALEKVDGK